MTQVAFFHLFLVGMPLLGWLTLGVEGKAISYFGWHLPPLVNEAEAAVEWAKEIHEVGGTTGHFLVASHTAAALFHHCVVRDNSLRRMPPGRG